MHPSRLLRRIAAVLTAGAMLLGLAGCGVAGEDSPLGLDALHYDVRVQPDGDMRVSETWNVRMERREDDNGDARPWHQLYRTFRDQPDRYGGITDIAVRNLDSGRDYKPTDMPDPDDVPDNGYDAVAGTFYYIPKGDGHELGWNIPPTTEGSARYRISYTVTDAVAALSDAAEFNWQFLDTSNGLYAKQVTGDIRWPARTGRSSVRAWLHFEHSPSSVGIDDDGVVRFNAEPLPSGMQLEVHATAPKDLVPDARRHRDASAKDVAADEQAMADAWAARQQARNRAVIALCVVAVILLVAMAAWNIWAIRTSRRLSRYRGDMTYWRDDPGVSPAVAARIDGLDASAGKAGRNGMAATLLSLAHKRRIGLTMQPRPGGRRQDVLITLRDAPAGHVAALAPSEQALLAVLQRVGGGYGRPFTMTELHAAGRTDYAALDGLFSAYETSLALEYGGQGLSVSGERYRTLPCVATIAVGVAAMIGFMLLGWPLLGIPVVAVAIVLALVTAMRAKSEVLTPHGNEVAGRVEGLKRYMLDFSDFSKRGVPDLAMWDFYMVYAAAFGISDTVMRQLHDLYPQLRDPAYLAGAWDSSPVMYSMFYHPYLHGTGVGMAGGAGEVMEPPDLGGMIAGNFADVQSAVSSLAHPTGSGGIGGGGVGGGGFGGSSGGGGGGGMGGR